MAAGTEGVFNLRDSSGVVTPFSTTTDPSNSNTAALMGTTNVSDTSGNRVPTANALAGTGAAAAQNALIATKPGMWQANGSIHSGTSAPACTKAAAGAGLFNIVDSLTISMGSAANTTQSPLQVKLVQDNAGTPVTLWEGVIGAPAYGSASIALTGLNILSTVANKTLDLIVDQGTITSGTFVSFAMSGFVSN